MNVATVMAMLIAWQTIKAVRRGHTLRWNALCSRTILMHHVMHL